MGAGGVALEAVALVEEVAAGAAAPSVAGLGSEVAVVAGAVEGAVVLLAESSEVACMDNAMAAARAAPSFADVIAKAVAFVLMSRWPEVTPIPLGLWHCTQMGEMMSL